MADYLNLTDEQKASILQHYLRPEIQKIMLDASADKEVVGSFGGTGYAKRPDMLEYENDITMLAKKGITSFHVSEESWHNPLDLQPGLSKPQLNSLRKAWDLLIDIDCPHWGISKIITQLLVNEIKTHGIKNVSVKFSGNKGFHIGVPNESFSHTYADEFPELPRKICEYLLARIFPQAQAEVIRIFHEEFGDLYTEEIKELFGKEQSEMIKNGQLDPYTIIEVDTILLSQRHLYRMVYSVNEKSNLVSIPINPDKVLAFEKKYATLPSAISKFSFMNREESKSGEAEGLVHAAREFSSPKTEFDDIQEQMKSKEEKSFARQEYEAQLEPIPEQCFADSIKKMLMGNLRDGKKRALFVLQNFLASAGWSYEDVEKRLTEWNKTHVEPIRGTIMQGQLLYLKQKMQNKQVPLPPNFDNINYYADILGPMDEFKKTKNPLSITKRRYEVYKKQLKKDERQTRKQEKASSTTTSTD